MSHKNKTWLSLIEAEDSEIRRLQITEDDSPRRPSIFRLFFRGFLFLGSTLTKIVTCISFSFFLGAVVLISLNYTCNNNNRSRTWHIVRNPHFVLFFIFAPLLPDFILMSIYLAGSPNLFLPFLYVTRC